VRKKTVAGSTGIVTISAPAGTAQTLAQALVESKAAACVQIIPGILSTYWWNGKIETSSEVLLAAKTLKSKLPVIKAILKEKHPYDLPELVFVPIQDGLPAYLSWIKDSLST
jgi:periplasmic divalent cation tolerance protein